MQINVGKNVVQSVGLKLYVLIGVSDSSQAKGPGISLPVCVKALAAFPGEQAHLQSNVSKGHFQVDRCKPFWIADRRMWNCLDLIWMKCKFSINCDHQQASSEHLGPQMILKENDVIYSNCEYWRLSLMREVSQIRIVHPTTESSETEYVQRIYRRLADQCLSTC